jgi:hypothetical protein
MKRFEREEWTLFTTLGTISQKAGVELVRLRRLALKELVDNALDASGNRRVYVGELEGRNGFCVSDDGPGLEPADVPHLFSIRRPLTSTKLLRLPSRGAAGNGLRVVAGAVMASEGSLLVFSKDKMHDLRPQDDGTTVADTCDTDYPIGTRIEISFGPSLPDDEDGEPLAWARQAIALGNQNAYCCKTSAHWYDSEAFHELCKAAGDMTVRQLLEKFDGCAGAKAGKLAADFKGRTASDLSRDESTSILLAARMASKPVTAKRLGGIGKDASDLRGAYACVSGTFEVRPGRGGVAAEIPFVVEAWAERSKEPELAVAVNRTPIASDVAIFRHSQDKGKYILRGCGLRHWFPMSRGVESSFTLNVTTPNGIKLSRNLLMQQGVA